MAGTSGRRRKRIHVSEAGDRPRRAPEPSTFLGISSEENPYGPGDDRMVIMDDSGADQLERDLAEEKPPHYGGE